MADELISLSSELYERLGEDDAIKHLARIGGFEEVPPTIQQFLTDPYFAGDDMCVGNTLYPIWRNVLYQIFPDPLYSEFNEICVTGAIGTGKSSVCLVGMFYDTCKLMFMKNPHRTYQLMPSTPIVIAFINATMSLSQSVLVQQFNTMIETSEFFKEQRAFAKKMEGRKAFLPHKTSIMSGSRGSHAYGRGVIMAMLSELNFQGAAVKDQAVQNYVHTTRRIKSRFGRGDGVSAVGRVWLDSSRKDETGFLENYVKDLGERNDVLVVTKSIWESQQSSGKFYFSGKTFPLFIGDQKTLPEILTKPGSSIGKPVELIIQVPIEYLGEFEVDMFGALRDFAGCATWSGNKFFSNEGLARDSLVLKNCAMRPIVEINFESHDDQLINYVEIEESVLGQITKQGLPKNAAWFIHFDLAKGKEGGDIAGVAMTRKVGETVVERHGRRLVSTVQRDYMYETNLVMGVKARAGQELPLSRFRNFVIDLIERGYNIQGVSADGWNSGDLLTSCKEAGITAVDEVSVDRTRDPYDHWKDTVIERRWQGPVHEKLTREMLNLQDMGKKIDHPDDAGLQKDIKLKPSKDLTDCIAGSLYWCKENSGGTKGLGMMNQFADAIKAEEKKANAMDFKSVLKNQALRSRSRSSGLGRNR